MKENYPYRNAQMRYTAMKEMAKHDRRQPFRSLQSVVPGLNYAITTRQFCKLRGKMQDTKTLFRMFQSLILSETEMWVRQSMKRAVTHRGSSFAPCLNAQKSHDASFVCFTRPSLTKTGSPAGALDINCHMK